MLRGKIFPIMKTLVILIILAFSATFLSGCVEQDGTDTKPTLIQTGSSTVLPLAMSWAEVFDLADISVSGGGSSHGLNALLSGDADLGDASRLMKGSDYEKVGCDPLLVKSDGTATAACSGVLPTKWIVAYDVLAVVINNDNSWATQLDYSQLYEIFTDDNPAVYWDEVTGLTDAPHQEIAIYAPDEASGTYDFFFEEIIDNWGKDDQVANPRLEMEDTIYHPSADDNVILNAIKDNKYAIGYFGYAYYNENQGALQTVKIASSGTDYQEASLTNVANYPMARPLHIYTDGVPDNDNVISDYLKYILGNDGQDIVPQVGYVKLDLVDDNLASNQLAKLS
jgi:phosphate transport system substrate-binding protein